MREQDMKGALLILLVGVLKKKGEFFLRWPRAE